LCFLIAEAASLRSREREQVTEKSRRRGQIEARLMEVVLAVEDGAGTAMSGSKAAIVKKNINKTKTIIKIKIKQM
jgi:hypothetical protein